jgi:hypothetical protein
MYAKKQKNGDNTTYFSKHEAILFFSLLCIPRSTIQTKSNLAKKQKNGDNTTCFWINLHQCMLKNKKMAITQHVSGLTFINVCTCCVIAIFCFLAYIDEG